MAELELTKSESIRMDHRGQSRMYLWLSILCLVMGIAIYTLFRDRGHLGFHVVDALGLGSWVDALRARCAGLRLPEFCIFCLPDGLWATSYILAIHHFWLQEPRRQRLLWASVIPVLGALSECLQWVGLLPGTFDLGDLACYLVPIVGYGVAIAHR